MGKRQNNRVAAILFLLFYFTVLNLDWENKVHLKKISNIS